MKTNIVNIKDINTDDIVNMLHKKSFVMAIPTDTVYALCCNANDESAVAKIYSLKKREIEKPLSLFIKNINELEKYVATNIIDVVAKHCEPVLKFHRGEVLPSPLHLTELLDKHWPGALTVIFKKKDNKYKYLTSGKDTIGIRIPNNKLLLDILNNIDFPLAQTSCNMSHEKELKNVTEIYDKFKDNIDLIIDSGNDIVGKASTIISVDNGNIKILREGDIVL